MALPNLPLLFTVILGWQKLPQRKYLLATTASTLFGIIYTVGYVYPINNLLMEQAGANETGDAITALAAKWIAADR